MRFLTLLCLQTASGANIFKKLKKVLDGGRGICYDSKYLEKGLFFCAQKRGHEPLREAKTIRFTGGAEE